MTAIKIISIISIWYYLAKNTFAKITNILYREKFVREIRQITDEAIVIISNTPCKMQDIIKGKSGIFVDCIDKEKNNEKYRIDNDLKELTVSFINSFFDRDVYCVKNNLCVLRQKIYVVYDNVFRKKSEMFKTGILFNFLISTGITIIII